MQYMYIPAVQTLRGQEAIKALNDYIQELEEQKPEELTDKQVKALTQSAKALISSIQSETPSKNVKPRQSFLSRIGFSSETTSIFSAGHR